MITLRRTIWVAAAALLLLPAGSASATTDAASTVEAVAADAADALAQEQALLAQANAATNPDQAAVTAARAELRAVDAAGFEALGRLEALGVDVTEAMRATLNLLPRPTAVGPAAEPPQGIVYDAAMADLDRITATPGAALAAEPSSQSPALGLLAVAALSLLALGAAALSNTLRQRPDPDGLEALVWSDGLTGVANRRRLDHDIDSHEEDGLHTAVIMLDVDHFKNVNDSFGHRHGDEVLRRIGTMISENVRFDDVVYRYGGEEFCVLLPGATTDDAREVGERIIAAAHSIDLPNGTHVTVSAGIAEAASGGLSHAVAAADEAMFIAKEQGRDRAVMAASADRSLLSA